MRIIPSYHCWPATVWISSDIRNLCVCVCERFVTSSLHFLTKQRKLKVFQILLASRDLQNDSLQTTTFKQGHLPLKRNKVFLPARGIRFITALCFS